MLLSVLGLMIRYEGGVRCGKETGRKPNDKENRCYSGHLPPTLLSTSKHHKAEAQ